MHPTIKYSEAALRSVPGLPAPRCRGRAGLLEEQLFTFCFPGDLMLQHGAEIRAGPGGGCGGHRRRSAGAPHYSEVSLTCSPLPGSLGPGKGCRTRRQQACKRPTLHFSAFPEGRLSVIQMTELSNCQRTFTFCGNKRRVCVCVLFEEYWCSLFLTF